MTPTPQSLMSELCQLDNRFGQCGHDLGRPGILKPPRRLRNIFRRAPETDDNVLLGKGRPQLEAKITSMNDRGGRHDRDAEGIEFDLFDLADDFSDDKFR